jgi:hypothetical protein
MSMNPRVTITTTHDGQFEIWINEAGRDLLVKQLLALSEHNEHFHLGDWPGVDVLLARRSYRATDRVLDTGKVLFRTDSWDRQHYPHVMDDTAG